MDYFLYECAECTKNNKKMEGNFFGGMCIEVFFIDAKNNCGNNQQQLERILHYKLLKSAVTFTGPGVENIFSKNDVQIFSLQLVN